VTLQEAVSKILVIVDDAREPEAPAPAVAVSAASSVSPGAKKARRSQMGEPAKSPSGEKADRKTLPPDGEDPQALNLRLAWLPRTDLGNVERFCERYRGKLLYCETLPGASRSEGGWLWWDGKRWSAVGASAKVKLFEHLTVRGIQEEAKACEKEAERIGKARPEALKFARKAQKAAAKKEKSTRGPRLVAVDGQTIEPPTETPAKPPNDEKIGGKIADLWGLARALKSWGRQSEANSKMVPISRHAGAYLGVEQSQLDADPFAFNVANGTLIFRRAWDPAADPSIEGCEAWASRGDFIKFKPHDPADLMTRIAPVEFSASDDCPMFQRFLAQVQPEDAMRAFLQQWKGYQMTGDTGEARVCLFLGGGRNGKGVFETATNYVLGDYAGSTGIETFTIEARSRSAGQATPELAKLPGIRGLRTSEPKEGARLDEALIKLVTGQDPVDARHLNRPFFTYVPQYKLTISGNHRPKIKGGDEGIWSRVTYVPWKVFIPETERDTKLSQKLQAEASGILNWLLDGLSVWMEKGLVLPETIKAATAEYRRDSDQLGRFLELCTEPEAEARVQSSLLLEVHNAWARAGGGSEWRQKGFTDAMADRGFKSTKSSVMFWLGLKLTKSVNDFVDHEGKPLHGTGGAAREKQRGVDEGDDSEIRF
jgi:putative DNA primase/helicase